MGLAPSNPTSPKGAAKPTYFSLGLTASPLPPVLDFRLVSVRFDRLLHIGRVSHHMTCGYVIRLTLGKS